MSRSQGALILICRSSRLNNFEWFSQQLQSSLAGEYADRVLVHDVDTRDQLTEKLQSSDADFDIAEIHLLTEFQADTLLVSAPANETLAAESLPPRPDRSGFTRNAVCRIWFWSESEHPNFSVLKQFQKAFGHHFFLLPLSQLKTRLANEQSVRLKNRPTGRKQMEPASTVSVFSLGKVAGYILLCGFAASMLVDEPLDWDFELDGEHDRTITHRDSDDRSSSSEPGKFVQYSWVHKRVKWEYEWYLASAWLANADNELEEASRYNFASGFWPSVYRHILSQNHGRLDSIAASLKRDADRLGYDRYELATLVLSFVQHIKYRIPRNRLELLTPPQSVSKRYGDCDTKSLLYVLLMQKLGYRTSIYLSMAYRHAMAGISVPAVGSHMSHGGHRYYFVETTYPGHRIGSIPQGMGNMAKWQLVRLSHRQ